MARVMIVYESHERPPEEDLDLIRAYFPHAQYEMSGAFVLDGEVAEVEQRLGHLSGWKVTPEGRLYIVTRGG